MKGKQKHIDTPCGYIQEIIIDEWKKGWQVEREKETNGIGGE